MVEHHKNQQEQIWLSPLSDLQKDYQRIYLQGQREIGTQEQTLFRPYVRPHTEAVVGGAFGDEGKGRLIDNLIEDMTHRPGIESVYVVRYQGGNNAGHTIEKNGLKLALHVVPSFVLYPEAKGIMDKGELIHPEDLQTEVAYIEEKTGQKIDGRLFLSEDAIVCTDLERAEEVLNVAKRGEAKGGTRRGISPSYAHFIDRTGMTIRDLMADNWEEKFGNRYDQYNATFKAIGQSVNVSQVTELADVTVPDFRTTKQTGKAAERTVGDKATYLRRLADAREWLIQKNLVTNIEQIYRQIHQDPTVGILFEGSQAAGLDAYNGTRPDVTSTDTTLSGIKSGTGHWLPNNIEQSYAVIKATYSSSVGARRMPTHVDASIATDATVDQKWAAWVQQAAHEYGTTTGRARDINILDLEMLRFNLRMSQAERVVVTHLDISEENKPVKVCTHYVDKDGKPTFYQPNQASLNQVTPQYMELPGWDGNACRSAKSFDDLPENAQKYLAFLQARLGLPIVAATTGPDRDNFVTFPGF